jgi:hypothetical protein
MNLASATETSARAKTSTASSLPSTTKATAAGTSTATVSRSPRFSDARSSSVRPSAAARLIRGSSAVMTLTATTACGSENSRKA